MINNKFTTNPLADDLNFILQQLGRLWEGLRNQHIFITGGTGFFGCWLLESLCSANAKFDLNLKATILTRSKEKFAAKCPHLFNDQALQFFEGDVRNFIFPEEKFSHIIHAATEASATLNITLPLVMLDTILYGTQRVLDFTKVCGAKSFLYVSSGAVYGRQPSEISHLSESYPCQPNLMDPRSAYSVGKGAAEHMSILYGNQFQFEVKIARSKFICGVNCNSSLILVISGT